MKLELTEKEQSILLKALFDSMRELNKINENSFIKTSYVHDTIDEIHNLYNKVNEAKE